MLRGSSSRARARSVSKWTAKEVHLIKLRTLLAVTVVSSQAALNWAGFTTVNAANSNTTTINGSWDVFGNLSPDTITGSAVVSYGSPTVGAPTHPSITSGTDNVTHAVPGFPTTNFANTGLTQYGQITAYKSTMYWGSIPGNSTGSTDAATWTITYNFSKVVPAGVHIVIFDLGVSPLPGTNTFTILPTLAGAAVATSGWKEIAYDPALGTGNSEHAVFVPGTTQSSFSNIGTPTGNYIFVNPNTAFDKLVFTGVSSRFNAFSIGFESDVPVPEPGTLGLGACGIIGLAVLARRRRKA